MLRKNKQQTRKRRKIHQMANFVHWAVGHPAFWATGPGGETQAEGLARLRGQRLLVAEGPRLLCRQRQGPERGSQAEQAIPTSTHLSVLPSRAGHPQVEALGAQRTVRRELEARQSPRPLAGHMLSSTGMRGARRAEDVPSQPGHIRGDDVWG